MLFSFSICFLCSAFLHMILFYNLTRSSLYCFPPLWVYTPSLHSLPPLLMILSFLWGQGELFVSYLHFLSFPCSFLVFEQSQWFTETLMHLYVRTEVKMRQAKCLGCTIQEQQTFGGSLGSLLASPYSRSWCVCACVCVHVENGCWRVRLNGEQWWRKWWIPTDPLRVSCLGDFLLSQNWHSLFA